MYSSYKYFGTDPRLYVFYPFLFFTFIYYSISTFIQGFGRPFDHETHREIVRAWKPKVYPSVDIFLPICGEDLRILSNTWEGIQNLQKRYKGKVVPYVLDDCDESDAKKLAKQFGFTYLVRPDRGYFKKAGNLRFGFANSHSQFVAIFDADFRPRPDFLDELLPYFDQDPHLGIVQSPQYFDVHAKQNWIERGAGAVQEYFYRSIQQNRQAHNGAICVGSNAVYKREALATNGGTTLIEHSEDVHTGFDLRRNGWGLLYVPVILAKGTCPSDLKGFFHQQYRWCKGSMSLLSSSKFWTTPMPLRSRLCYLTGFLYYIHTAIYTFIGPLVPLSLLLLVPHQARLINYLPLVPAVIYNTLIFPLWHKTKYRFETLSTKLVYGWAHFFAILDTFIGRGLEWHPTGSTHSKSNHFLVFRFSVVIFSLVTALLWVGSSFWYMTHWNFWDFAPVFVSGLVYLIVISRIVFTSITLSDSHLTPQKSLALGGFLVVLLASTSLVYLLRDRLPAFTALDQVHAKQFALAQAPKPSSHQPIVLASETSTPTEYTLVAAAGDSVTTLNRQAVTKYMADHEVQLSSAQRVYLETSLTQQSHQTNIDVGQSITVNASSIEHLISQSTSLTPYQLHQWEHFSQSVVF